MLAVLNVMTFSSHEERGALYMELIHILPYVDTFFSVNNNKEKR